MTRVTRNVRAPSLADTIVISRSSPRVAKRTSSSLKRKRPPSKGADGTPLDGRRVMLCIGAAMNLSYSSGWQP